jgi:hypothetical protein
MEFLKGILGGKDNNTSKENLNLKNLEVEVKFIEFSKNEEGRIYFENFQKYKESLKYINKEVKIFFKYQI